MRGHANRKRCKLGIRYALIGGAIAAALFAGGCSHSKTRSSQDHLAKGQACVSNGDWKCAMAEFSESARLDPSSSEPHLRMAQIALHFRDDRRAYEELRTTLDLDPSSQEAQLQAAALQLELGDLGGMKRRVDTVLKRDPSSVEGHLLQAEMLLRLEQPDAARAEIERVTTENPARPEPFVVLGILEQSQKHPEAAEANFKKALGMAPQLKDVQIRLGRLYVAQKRWSDAETVLQSAVDHQPNAAAYAALVDYYFQRQQMSKAEETARQAAQRLPDDPTAYRLLGNLKIATHAIPAAAEEYQRLLKLHSEDNRVHKNCAQLMILMDRTDQASQLVGEAQRADPFDEEPMLQQAQLDLLQNTPEVARQLLEGILARQPNQAMAHYYLGLELRELRDYGGGDREIAESEKILVHQGDLQAGLALLLNAQGDVDIFNVSSEKIMEVQPLSVAGYARAAAVDILREHFDQAEADLQRAIAAGPQNPLGYSRVGDLRVRQGKLEQAEQMYRRALDLDPGFGEAAAGIIDLYKRQNQTARAVSWLDTQIARVPASSSLQVLRGQLYLEQGDASKAEAAARKALQLDGSRDQAYLLLSRSQEKQGDSGAALTTAQTWVKDRATAAAQTRLGELLDRQGKWQDAQDAYRAALKIDEGFTQAANNLAVSLLQHDGNLDVAVTYAEIARSKAPLNPQYADTLGWAYYQKGGYKSARPLLEEAVAKLPQSASVNYHLAMTCKKLLDTSLAEEYLKKALQIDPSFPEAEAARHTLQVIDPTYKAQ